MGPVVPMSFMDCLKVPLLGIGIGLMTFNSDLFLQFWVGIDPDYGLCFF